MQSIDRPVNYLDIRVGLPTHIFTAQKDRFFEGHHVRRCPIFCSKSSEKKKRLLRPEMPNFFAQKQVNSKIKKGHRVSRQ